MSNNLFIIFNNRMSQKLLIKQKAGNLEITNRPSSSSKKGGKSGGGENAKNNKSVTTRGPIVKGGSTSSSSPKTAKISNGGRPSSSGGGRNIASNTIKGGFVVPGPYDATKKRSWENKSKIENLEKRNNILQNEIDVLKEDMDYSKTHVMWMHRFLTKLMIRSSANVEDLKNQLRMIDFSEGSGIKLLVIGKKNNNYRPTDTILGKETFNDNIFHYHDDISKIDQYFDQLKEENVYELKIQHIKPKKSPTTNQ